MSSLSQQDLWEEWFREFAPGFQALSPHIRYSKRARVSYAKYLASKTPAELLCTGFCRNPASIQPWEQHRECRSLEIATGQARQYNAMISYPSIPQEMLQDLLQDSISPSMLKSRRYMQGCRIATCAVQGCTVIITAGGARGHLLLVTTMPKDKTKPHNTEAFQCMSCSIFELKLEPADPPNGFTALHPAHCGRSESPWVQQSSDLMPRLAVRHALGLSIYQLQPPQLNASSKVFLTPLWYIPAVMEVVALHWSMFLPGQLLYTSIDLFTYAVNIGSQSDASGLAPGRRTKDRVSTTQHHVKHQRPQELSPQPSLVVIPESGVPYDSQGDAEVLTTQPQEGTSTNQPGRAAAHAEYEAATRVAIAVVAHPQRVFLAIGSSIFVAEMSLLPSARPSVWARFIEIEPSLGPISSICTPPWYQAFCPRLAELLRHMIFVGCKESVLAFHVASPATRMLCTSMPPHVKDGCILSVNTWQHLLSFPERNDTMRHTKHAPTSPDCKETGSYGAWGVVQASGFWKEDVMSLDVKGCSDQTVLCGQVDAKQICRKTNPTGVVALGQVVGMCENDGSMFVCPFVVSAALRGLLMHSLDAKRHGSAEQRASHMGDQGVGVSTQSNKRRMSAMCTNTAGTTSGEGDTKCYSGFSSSSIQAVYVAAHNSCIVEANLPASFSHKCTATSDVEPSAQPAVLRLNDDSSSDVQKSAVKCSKIRHNDQGEQRAEPRHKQVTDRATASSIAPNEMHASTQQAVSLPWVFAESAVSQWLGTPHVFGFPIKEHIHSVPQLNAEVAAAEAACILATAKRFDDRVDDEDADALRRVGVEKHDVLLPVTLKEPGVKQRAREKFADTEINLQADQKAALVVDVMRMYETCFDSAGCVVQWTENQESQCDVLTDYTQSDLIAGALRVEELLASGNGTELYEALIQRAPGVTCIRSTCAGSPIVEEFEWHVQREQLLSPILPEGVVWKLPSCRQQECLETVKALQPVAAIAGMPPAAVVKHRNQFTTSEQFVKPAAGLLEGARTFAAWRSNCVTCSRQLHSFSRCWSHSLSAGAEFQSSEVASGADSLLPSSTTPLTDMFSWQAPDPYSFQTSPPHPDVPFQAPDKTVGEAFAWPFNDGQLTAVTGTGASGSLAQPWGVVALHVFKQLFPRIQNATTVAELWAAVLHLLAIQCGAQEVVAHQLQVENEPKGIISKTQMDRKRRRQDENVATKACCQLQRSMSGEALLCCRQAEWRSVRAREIHGDLLQLSSNDVKARFTSNKPTNASSELEEACKGGFASGQLVLQNAVKCNSLPGRLITGYRTVHLHATKRQATDVNAQLENSRILLRLHLKTQRSDASSSADLVGLGSGEILRLVVTALKALSPGNKLQLLHVQNPCWYYRPSVTYASTVRRCRVLGSDSSHSDDLACLHEWVVLPVCQSIDKAVNEVHKLRVDGRSPPALAEEVQKRVEEVLDDWL